MSKDNFEFYAKTGKMHHCSFISQNLHQKKEMTNPTLEKLIQLAWVSNLCENQELRTQNGDVVTVITSGEVKQHNSIEIVNAEISINNLTLRGSVTVHANSSDWQRDEHKTDLLIDTCILDVVLNRDAVVCRTNGEIVPSVKIELPENLIKKHKTLISNIGKPYCGEIIAAMKQPDICSIITRLAIDRLERKYNDFLEIYKANGENWIQVYYIMLFGAMGGGSNKDAYIKLAQTVTYSNLCKVKNSRTSVEALLLGAAGMLNDEKPDFFPDQYTITLQKEFEQLKNRFSIQPMAEMEWNLIGKYKNNHPVVRIVELAAMLASKEFLFDQLIKCTTPKEIYKLLEAEASEYWSTHDLPSVKSNFAVKRVGEQTLNVLTINFVAIMIFTHGKVTNREEYTEQAIDILESLSAETNRYIKAWREAGIDVQSALYSQGLMQLTKEFCMKNECPRCIIGRKVLTSK